MNEEETQVQTPEVPELAQSQAITPEQLSPVPDFDMPEPNIAPTTPVQNLTQDILSQFDLTQQEEKAQREQRELLSNISGAQPELEGQTQALQNAERQAGVGQLRQSLSGNNARINQLQAEINQDDIVLAQQLRNEELRDTLLPFAENSKARIAGDAQIVRALKNAEIGVLNARSMALQGDIYLALDTAQKAVDAKYAPIKDRIATYTAQLEAIKPYLNSAEKKQLAEQEANTSLKLNEINRLQEEEKQVQALGLQAIQRGMNPSEVGFILGQNPSLAEATSLFGQALQTPTEAEALDTSIKEAELQGLRLRNQNLGLEADVYLQELNNAIGGSLPQLADDTQASRMAGDIGTLTKLIVDPKLNNATGAVRPLFKSASYSDFTNAVDQIVKGKTLDQLVLEKEQGATFGALSDSELSILGDSATIINAARRERNGKTLGYRMSDEALREELIKWRTYDQVNAIRQGVQPSAIGVIETPEGYFAPDPRDPDVFIELPVQIQQ